MPVTSTVCCGRPHVPLPVTSRVRGGCLTPSCLSPAWCVVDVSRPSACHQHGVWWMPHAPLPVTSMVRGGCLMPSCLSPARCVVGCLMPTWPGWPCCSKLTPGFCRTTPGARTSTVSETNVARRQCQQQTLVSETSLRTSFFLACLLACLLRICLLTSCLLVRLFVVCLFLAYLLVCFLLICCLFVCCLFACLSVYFFVACLLLVCLLVRSLFVSCLLAPACLLRVCLLVYLLLKALVSSFVQNRNRDSSRVHKEIITAFVKSLLEIQFPHLFY